jgi:hypothetical protein
LANLPAKSKLRKSATLVLFVCFFSLSLFPILLCVVVVVLLLFLVLFLISVVKTVV